jgi:hypothetical protein
MRDGDASDRRRRQRLSSTCTWAAFRCQTLEMKHTRKAMSLCLSTVCLYQSHGWEGGKSIWDVDSTMGYHISRGRKDCICTGRPEWQVTKCGRLSSLWCDPAAEGRIVIDLYSGCVHATSMFCVPVIEAWRMALRLAHSSSSPFCFYRTSCATSLETHVLDRMGTSSDEIGQNGHVERNCAGAYVLYDRTEKHGLRSERRRQRKSHRHWIVGEWCRMQQQRRVCIPSRECDTEEV